jgi:HPr kinase/phosphorylase
VVEERTGLEENTYEILGMKVPHIELYVRPGRDMARLVEVAALTQALKRMGHDPGEGLQRPADRLHVGGGSRPAHEVKPVEREERAPGQLSSE